jgi:hypothetical protein
MTRFSHRLASVTGHVGLAAALALTTLAAPACTASDEAGRKAERAAEKAGEAAEKAGEKAGEAAEKIGDKLGKAGEKLGEAAEKLGDRIGPAAEHAGRTARDLATKGAAVAAAAGADAAVVAAGALRTGAVKAALLEDRSIDVSDVDVDTDQAHHRITIKGRVRSAAVRDKVIDIARGTAPGYTIANELTIR